MRMKAAVLQGTKTIEVLDWHYPAPLPREVIVKVKSFISHRFTIDELPVVMADHPNLKVSKGIVN